MVRLLRFERRSTPNLGSGIIKLVLGAGFEPALTANLASREYKARRANHYTTLAKLGTHSL